MECSKEDSPRRIWFRNRARGVDGYGGLCKYSQFAMLKELAGISYRETTIFVNVYLRQLELQVRNRVGVYVRNVKDVLKSARVILYCCIDACNCEVNTLEIYLFFYVASTERWFSNEELKTIAISIS